MATSDSGSRAAAEPDTPVHFPGPAPGTARAGQSQDGLFLENDVLRMTWSTDGDSLSAREFENLLTGEAVGFAHGDLFQLVLDGAPAPRPLVLRATDMTLAQAPAFEASSEGVASTRVADRAPGQCLKAEFVHVDHGLRVVWTAELRDGANALRLTMHVQPDSWEAISEVVILAGCAHDARVAGTVDGVPLVGNSLFIGAEHPRALNTVMASENAGGYQIRCALPHIGLVRSPRTVTVSAVLGVAPPGQLRRAFLHYLQREAPKPYTQYLHYNNGYEIGLVYWQHAKDGTDAARKFRLREEELYQRLVDQIGTELVSKRAVQLDGVVHDFMWDDENAVWRFHEGYPDGFAKIRETAATYGAEVGVWFGPWGGYAGRKARVEGGRKQGFLISANGLTLSCPNYRGRMLSAARGMIRHEHVNYFKLDGFALGNTMGGAGEYASEADALIEVIDSLRELDPDVVVNPSTGSWPSPFWLLHADVVWRQGRDSGVIRTGSPRQRWITYRDAQTYEHVVKASPLYPVNALMLHGVYINGSRFAGDPNDPDGNIQNFDLEDVAAEVRTFFGSGTSLQELYVDPSLMNDATWDVLAEAAKWARNNADILADTHWIGGDPAQLEIYGWASWSPDKSIIVLRNPGDAAQTWTLRLADALELPEGSPSSFTLCDVWNTRSEVDGWTLSPVQPMRIDMQPFDVLVLEAQPARE